MSSVIPMLKFVIVMLLGYVIGKRKMFSDKAQSDFSTLITNVAMPAVVLSSINDAELLGSKQEAIQFLLISAGWYVFCILIGFIVVKILKIPKGSKGAVLFLMTFNNNGFIGLPLIMEMYGQGAMFYASLINIPFNLLCYSFGVWAMSHENSEEKSDFSLKKTFLSAGFLAAAFSLICFLSDFKIPTFLHELFKLVGGITTPLAMLVVGMNMAKLNIKEAFGDIKIYAMIAIKMVIIPILVYFAFRPIISNQLLLSILVVISAMPGPASATTFAIKYNNDAELCSKYIVVSTLLSVVIIPIISSVLGLA